MEHLSIVPMEAVILREITKLIKDFDERITLSDHKLYDVFGLENGEEQLKKVFTSKKIDYEMNC